MKYPPSIHNVSGFMHIKTKNCIKSYYMANRAIIKFHLYDKEQLVGGSKRNSIAFYANYERFGSIMLVSASTKYKKKLWKNHFFPLSYTPPVLPCILFSPSLCSCIQVISGKCMKKAFFICWARNATVYRFQSYGNHRCVRRFYVDDNSAAGECHNSK